MKTPLTYGNIVVNLSTNTVKVEDTPVELLGKVPIY